MLLNWLVGDDLQFAYKGRPGPLYPYTLLSHCVKTAKYMVLNHQMLKPDPTFFLLFFAL